MLFFFKQVNIYKFSTVNMEENKHKKSKFISITDKISSMSQMQAMILTVIILALITGGVYVYFISSSTRTKEHKTPSPSSTPAPVKNKPTETPEPTDTPEVLHSKPAASKTGTDVEGASTIDCVGPDGKHLKISQDQCDSFNKAWATATPTPSPATYPTDTPTDSPTPSPVLSPEPSDAPTVIP